MIDFETWWNSSSADEFRRLNDDMDGRVVRPVWDAAIRATLSSQKATSAAPSPEAAQPTQAEAPVTTVAAYQRAKEADIDRMLSQLIEERDERQQVLDDVLDLVLGQDRAEWSSAYGFRDAVNDVGERMAALATQQAEQGEAGEIVSHACDRNGEVFATVHFPGPYDPYNQWSWPRVGAKVSTATPPAPQQPEALAQQERDGEGGK